MKKWRVARVQKDMTLFVAEQGYWTKSGAQAAATHLNTTFGGLAQFAGALLGHNYFATSTDKIPAVERALEMARGEKTVQKEKGR